MGWFFQTLQALGELQLGTRPEGAASLAPMFTMVGRKAKVQILVRTGIFETV